MVKTNKDGQLIGRKGAKSRACLLDAARQIAHAMPAQKLTVSAIARTAGLASQTFYLYFKDVDELLLRLGEEAAEDLGEVRALLDVPWDRDTLFEQAERFVTAFYRHWERHRPILNIRNFMADGGLASFIKQRNEVSLPILQGIANQILSAHGDRTSERDAYARAVIFLSATERMAARYFEAGKEDSMIGGEDLKRAEAHILFLLLSSTADE
jgi:AcrR family transcriptional regulator